MKKVYRFAVACSILAFASCLSRGAIPEPGASGARKPGDMEAFQAGELGFEMAYLPAGLVFRTGVDDMGLASLERAAWMGRTEVSYRLYRAVWLWACSSERGETRYSIASGGHPGAIPSADMPETPDPRSTDLHPVTMLSWRDAMVWCNALTEWYDAMTGSGYDCVYYADPEYRRPLRATTREFSLSPGPGSQDDPYVKAPFPGNRDQAACSASGFRLPAILEWELAARYIADANGDGDIRDKGEFTPGSWASGATGPAEEENATAAVAVSKANGGRIAASLAAGPVPRYEKYTYGADGRTFTEAVASLAPNALGLYDMSGNAWEWCFEGRLDGPRPIRYTKGGAWNSGPGELAVGSMNYPTLYYYNSWVGMRLARSDIAPASTAGTPAATSAPARIVFDFDGGAEGWSPWNQVGSFAADGGSLRGLALGGDPFMGAEPLVFSASSAPVIRVRERAWAGDSLALYWITEDTPLWREDKSIHLPLVPDGLYHDYHFPLGLHPLWAGKTVIGLRLDPTEGPAGPFEVDSIAAEAETPESAASYALYLYRRGDPEGALKALAGAGDEARASLAGLAAAGLAFHDLGRHAEATDRFALYVAGGGSGWRELATYADSLYETKRFAEALPYVDGAIASAPEDQLWWLWYRKADLEKRRGSPPLDLVEAASRAIALRPDEVLGAYEIRAEAYLKLERYAEAQADFLSLEHLYWRQGRKDQADRILKRIADSIPLELVPGRAERLAALLAGTTPSFALGKGGDLGALSSSTDAKVSFEEGGVRIVFNSDQAVSRTAIRGGSGSVAIRFSFDRIPSLRLVLRDGKMDTEAFHEIGLRMWPDGSLRARTGLGKERLDSGADRETGRLKIAPGRTYWLLATALPDGGVYVALWDESGQYRDMAFTSPTTHAAWSLKLQGVAGDVILVEAYLEFDRPLLPFEPE